ncbi:uncharacterized protein LOC123879245 [Maniola jurtina]|uniref:uncharacterized protein LOC123879245 n=1 Tax=Maniola jurtina TaxID=191418 RepID=UPI001E68B30B|nr:uncharacterized protein LOC123879245 [Maniola jurtina]
MILNQNYEIPVSFTVYLFVKVVCKLFKSHLSMHNKPTLTSIAEEDEDIKWVSKKKHEALKAKYKCLKKLFQIYDASVISILPETYAQRNQILEDDQKIRKQKSRRTKTDENTANEIEIRQTENSPEIAVLADLKLDQIPSSDSKTSKTFIPKSKDDKSRQDSKENLSINSQKDIEIQPDPVPYLVINEKRKPTRFQSFIQRILGLRRNRYSYGMSNEHEYAASENNIPNRYKKRRRRSIRLRRRRRKEEKKKIHSESDLREANSPVILSYVQTIQRNCLMDTTPRHCPIVGCKKLLYGIINYNDHLNLCHFTERTYICVCCHKGFPSERDKTVHENEHIGIMKIAVPSTTRFSTKIASDTQTDPEITKIDIPEDKLKKIVSFFDKIADPDQIIAEIKKNRCSETNLLTLHRNSRTNIDSMSGSDNSDSENTSSLKTHSKETCTIDSDGTPNSKYICIPVRCKLCGKNFDYRRQLNRHMDVHHRTDDKFTKYNNCVDILNRDNHQTSSPTQSLTRSLTSTDVSNISNSTKLSRRKSNKTLSYDPSTNIVYTSMDTVKKPSFVQKVRKNFFYKWEPGTKIIRV